MCVENDETCVGEGEGKAGTDAVGPNEAEHLAGAGGWQAMAAAHDEPNG